MGLQNDILLHLSSFSLELSFFKGITENRMRHRPETLDIPHQKDYYTPFWDLLGLA